MSDPARERHRLAASGARHDQQRPVAECRGLSLGLVQAVEVDPLLLRNEHVFDSREGGKDLVEWRRLAGVTAPEDALFEVEPEGFTKARNDLAARLKAEGDAARAAR